MALERINWTAGEGEVAGELGLVAYGAAEMVTFKLRHYSNPEALAERLIR